MPEGDNMLSAIDLTLWSLVNEVLLRWKTLVLFKWDMMNVPEGKAGYVHFMVPHDAENKDAILGFLREETAQFKQEPSIFPIGDVIQSLPGQIVQLHIAIEEFSGLSPYVEKDHLEREGLRKLREFRKIMRGS